MLELNDALVEPRRRLGFTDFLSAPAGAIATGQSALVSLSGLPRREAIVASPVALHVNLAPPSEPGGGAAGHRPIRPAPGPGPGQGRRRMGGDPAGPVENPYPRVLMGSIAHFRQAMLDADHLRKLDTFLEKTRRRPAAIRPGAQGPPGCAGQEAAGLVGGELLATRSTGRSTSPRSSARPR